MSQTIPHCPICSKSREAELERKASRKPNGKGKGKAKWGSDSEDDDDENEWGGGEPGIMKVRSCLCIGKLSRADSQPDITFFGQALDFEFDESLFKDREKVDLLVVIGTSLKVAPVSEVLGKRPHHRSGNEADAIAHIPHSVPQIYINLTPVLHVKPDVSPLKKSTKTQADVRYVF